MQLARRVPAFDSIEVWGEGADQGTDKAHWLSTDLAPVSAQAAVAADGSVQAGKLGQRPLRLREGALRSNGAVEAVAKAVNVSPFHFCKLFKRATGLTFTDFVNRARVEKAKRMLMKPDARITEVAYDVGFQSLSHFNRS